MSLTRRDFFLTSAAAASGVALGETVSASRYLSVSLQAGPRTFDPHQTTDVASELVRYLTAGSLVRVNRETHQVEPELAERWQQVSERVFEFTLRAQARFSNGAPVTPADVKASFERLPTVHSPLLEAFGGEAPKVEVGSGRQVRVLTARALPSFLSMLDQLSIVCAGDTTPASLKCVSGPFVLEEYRPGVEVKLARNPHYWKRDREGRALPYLDGVRIRVLANRQNELLAFERGELDVIQNLEPEGFARLGGVKGVQTYDLGASLDPEFLWFNQMAAAGEAERRRSWFRQTGFRRAVSLAIRRDDLCRLAFRGHAKPAAGPVSVANRSWFNTALAPLPFDPDGAKRQLAGAGFRYQGTTLVDGQGMAVTFTLITNSGATGRERMAALVRQDLAAIGIEVKVAALEFGSLVERIAKTHDYDAALLGYVNVGIDPNEQMNVWLSSSPDHPWEPSQPKPRTSWEAELDDVMRRQSAAQDAVQRKKLMDRMQTLVVEQQPVIYLVNKNILLAARNLRNLRPSVLDPHLLWNAEWLRLESGA